MVTWEEAQQRYLEAMREKRRPLTLRHTRFELARFQE